jgi:hypothetical protein
MSIRHVVKWQPDFSIGQKVEGQGDTTFVVTAINHAEQYYEFEVRYPTVMTEEFLNNIKDSGDGPATR